MKERGHHMPQKKERETERTERRKEQVNEKILAAGH